MSSKSDFSEEFEDRNPDCIGVYLRLPFSVYGFVSTFDERQDGCPAEDAEDDGIVAAGGGVSIGRSGAEQLARRDEPPVPPVLDHLKQSAGAGCGAARIPPGVLLPRGRCAAAGVCLPYIGESP